MRVVFLAPHTKVSGGVKVILRLAQGLKAKGVQVCVVVKKYNDKMLFWFGPTNFKVLEDRDPSYHTLPECDVLVNYCDGDPFLPLFPNTKHILLLQGFGHDSDLEKNNLLFPYDGVVVVSKWLGTLARNCGQKKIFIISPGVDDIFSPAQISKSKVPIIGTLHHNMASKNVSMFEDAIKSLYQDRHFGVKPLFLTARPTAVDSLAEENIPYSVIGNPPQSMLPFIYSSCTAWVSPSYKEGFGLTTLEAMACGTPIVTLKNFGLDDYLKHGENCLIVKNKKEMADAIVELVNSPELRANFARNGNELASKFTWDKTVNQFHHALQEIIK